MNDIDLEPGAADLIVVFDQTFADTENTRLLAGLDEPIYLPADDVMPYHRIEFAHGYFSSALHEIAHWCIAGKARRLQVDYGYWYEPDGRNQTQQLEFQQLEIKPQALEWLFHEACGKAFRVSLDNLNVDPVERVKNEREFAENVYQQVLNYLNLGGIPPRALVFIDALLDYYKRQPLQPAQFKAINV